MNTRKFSVAVAALLLGMQIGSPASAAISEADIALIEAYVMNGQIEELLVLLQLNPELLALAGALGDALRSFYANPSQATLVAVAQMADGQIAVALKAAINPGASIY